MMKYTTGLTDNEFDELLAWLRQEGVEGYLPILGLSGSLRATLMYLRQNPITSEKMEFTAAMPYEFKRILRILRQK